MLNSFGKYVAGLCLFLTLPGYLKAENSVTMIEPNGKETIFLLSTSPRVSMEDGTVIVETKNDRVEYTGEGPLKFVFSETGAIEKFEKDLPLFKINQFSIEASNLKPETNLQILDLSGKLIISQKTDTNGNITIPVSYLPTGVYIVKSYDKKFKFYKK
ncbi:MAG: T9SS type A sorting domain-containing protein [Muribaculaceae bacterium]|nr:T9SS type A sorting domain-containing protein [Muribaculaceae bacterium]